MSMPHIRHEVADMLAETRFQIAEARASLIRGGDRDKVVAAGVLIALQRKRATLEERLNDIDSHPDASETLVQWIKEEVFNLRLQVEDWIAPVSEASARKGHL